MRPGVNRKTNLPETPAMSEFVEKVRISGPFVNLVEERAHFLNGLQGAHELPLRGVTLLQTPKSITQLFDDHNEVNLVARPHDRQILFDRIIEKLPDCVAPLRTR
jgi:hypothetical protein